jgi:hypothetical protein
LSVAPTPTALKTQAGDVMALLKYLLPEATTVGNLYAVQVLDRA